MSSHPFKVKAVFEYNSPHDEDLNFPESQIITVTEDDEEDWYTGEYVDAAGVKKEGIFPRNFVEKYEPTAPPRPTRARPKKEIEPVASTAAASSTSQAPAKAELPQEPPDEEIQEGSTNHDLTQANIPIVAVAPAAAPIHAEALPAATKPPPKPAPVVVKNSIPPPVSEKPGGSFRDRIAAFNKSAAPPPAPFKPGGLGSGGSSFIKKPFVAPPPSKDAFVPPPREAAPQKVYRRDEDPEIAAREVENLENAERAGLAPTTNEGEGEDQPKPTSLKERIALLQKQQMEQAARHADAAQKKEKPKRPPKKRTESHNTAEAHEDEELSLEKQDSHGTIGKKSMDSDEPSGVRTIPRRRTSKSSPAVPGIPRESFGDGNDADMSGAGDTTEEHEEASTGHDDSDERPKAKLAMHPTRGSAIPPHEPDLPEEDDDKDGEEEEIVEEGGDEEEVEEEDIDPEVRRREELRARMAKMSGGMGMVGMFGGGMPMSGPAIPPKKKPSSASEKKQSSEYSRDEASVPAGRAPPVPGIALPGMTRVKSPEEANKQLEVEDEDEDDNQDESITETRPADEVPEIEDVKPAQPARTKTTSRRGSNTAPPVPGGRPAPPPVPTEARPLPPPPPTMLMSASAGSESDDEMSIHAPKPSVETPTSDASPRAVPPRPSGPPVPSRPADGPTSPRSPPSKRASYFSNEPVPTSPTTPGANSKRASRVPPIPGSSPVVTSTQNRAPPPPPPVTSLSRSSTGDSHVLQSPMYAEQDESDEEITEYEGDYDTDIASTTPHKDALKSSMTESNLDNTPARSAVVSPSGAPPPLPPMTTHRAVPPPLPAQPPPNSRPSADMPRAAPPPPPPREQSYAEDNDDDDYDPYRYTAPKQGIPIVGMATPSKEKGEDDLYSVSPPRSQPPRSQQERAAPPPPPRDPAQPPPSANRGPPRQSMDVQRTQAASRRSTDLNRISMDSGFVANDVDLGQGSLWWTQPNSTPPIFQGRKDILYETEEAISTKRGGKSTATRDLYILFQDYSQTVITVRYDPHSPSDASLEQRHEPPPSRLRQDQLEESYERFGRGIAEAVASKKDSVVGDGTPAALITELLKPFPDSLLPVGTRAYGAVVYGNLANASTTQNDEIRPGDIITFRNAKFQGKHGPMHGKYSVEVGGSGVGHVGVVAEWDGTKKKVRAWEQGREKKKLGLESFKLDDLRSGEVKIWRVMERGWVGWEGTN